MLKPTRTTTAAAALKSWRDVIKIHPAADVFPSMSQAELKELAADIDTNGLHNRIAIWSPSSEDGNYALIDGRSRLDALSLLGLLCVDDEGLLATTKRWTSEGWRDEGRPDRLKQNYYLRGEDPYQLALSFNLHRRHLTPEQKRELIAKLIKSNPEKSNRQIADQVKASHPHVAKVRTELEKTGDVETVSTSIDTKGRKQPRRRAAKPDSTTSADKPHKAGNAKDIGLQEFNGHVLRLLQMTSKAKPERFAKTSVNAADLSQLGRFLAEVAGINTKAAANKIIEEVIGILMPVESSAVEP
jgi:hypothetical protein